MFAPVNGLMVLNYNYFIRVYKYKKQTGVEETIIVRLYNVIFNRYNSFINKIYNW